MPYTLKDIANQNFQPGSSFLKSVANASRKAMCTVYGFDDVYIPGPSGEIPDAFRAMQKQFLKEVCNLPEEPVPIPDRKNLPSNAGKCQCQAYRVVSNLSSAGFPLGNDTRTVRGPITLFRDQGSPPQPNIQTAGYTHFGSPFEPCRSTPVRQELIVTGVSGSPQVDIVSTTPVDINGNTVVDCQRPTFPEPAPGTKLPPGNPTIDIPNPDGTTINFPIIPVPIPVLPNVSFEPKFVFDVGGVNIEFNLGGVNISFNPQLVAPVIVSPFPPIVPPLPPSVQPLPVAGGGKDCCAELIALGNNIRGDVEIVRSRVIDVQNTANTIDAVQTGEVVPLLKDIQECACPPDSELFSSWQNLQTITVEVLPKRLIYAVVQLQSGQERKVFNVPGGVRVNIAGWFAFGREGVFTPRQPLQYDSNLCVPDRDDYTTFTYSVYTGLTANGSTYTKKAQT